MLLHNQEVRDISSLQLLTQAPSKSFVDQVFLRVFHCRLDGFSATFIQSVAQELFKQQQQQEQEQQDASKNTITIEQQKQVHEMLECALFLIQLDLFHNAHSLESMEEMAKVIFSPRRVKNMNHVPLMKLIVGVIKKYGPLWRRMTSESLIGLPKLQEMKWRIDMKAASNSIDSLNAPTVVVDLDILDQVMDAQAMPENRTVQFELNRETLEIMLGGLTKIRDQLSSVK